MENMIKIIRNNRVKGLLLFCLGVIIIKCLHDGVGVLFLLIGFVMITGKYNGKTKKNVYVTELDEDVISNKRILLWNDYTQSTN